MGVDKIALDGTTTHVQGSDLAPIGSMGIDTTGAIYLGTYDGSGNSWTYKISGGQATLYNTGHWITRFDSNGNGYASDFNSNQVIRYAPGGQSFTVVAGTGQAGFSGDGQNATAAQLRNPQAIAVQSNGTFVVYDNYRLREVVNATGIINTVVGNGSTTYGGDGGLGTNAQLSSPIYIALDHSGNVYFSDQGSGSGSNRIRKVDATSGIITTVVGNGAQTGGDPPDGTPALQASIQPSSVAVDSAGTIYFSHVYSVRKVVNGVLATVSGASVPGGLAFAQLAADSLGNLYYGTAGSLGKIAPNNSVMLLAGSGTSNSLGSVRAIAIDNTGANVYYVEAVSNTLGVLKSISSGGGAVSTIASGFALQGGSSPIGLAIDLDGSILLSEAPNNLVKRVSTSSNTTTITTVAGTGTRGFTGDGMSALTTQLNAPYGLAVDSSGRIFVSDLGNQRVRSLTSATSVTVATNPSGLNINVDGVAAVAPQTYAWIPGSSHTIAASSPQTLNTTTYNFASWSDSGAASHGVSAPASPTTLTASFNAIVASTITLSPSKLQFGYSGQQITSMQTVSLTFNPSASIGWTASSNQANISVSPTSGTGNAVLQINASPGGNGMITVTAPGAANSPQQIQVNTASVATTLPFGSFDTPVNNTSGIAGAIPVTGWALDNIEVTGVGIWREPVPGEATTPNGLVFIGNAVFVAGARPDVQATFPNFPFNYRAGWGYALLTNFLPNASGLGTSGNGTYKLHAIITNTAGQTLDLGARAITVDNAHASKPFGTIDTPSQGGTASGNAYVNFGWALTQNSYVIPMDSSTITVILDGLPMDIRSTISSAAILQIFFRVWQTVTAQWAFST